jgi:hypothetical protein
MRAHLPLVFATLWLLAFSACSQSQSALPPSAASSESCDNFEPPTESLHGVYDIPSNASGSSAECATDEALASGQEVVGYGDMPFFWQSLDALSQPISMPLAIASSPPNEPREFEKVAPPGAPRAPVSNGTLPLTVAAAYRQTNGVVDTFQGAAASNPALDGLLTEFSAGAGADGQRRVEQPNLQAFTIDPKVWMELGSYNSSVSVDASGRISGTASGGYRIYRLNTRNPRYDYFLVTLDGLNKVQGFNNCKYDFPRYYCEWLNRGLRLSVYFARISDARVGVGEVTEAQPKSEVTQGKYEVAEGADLKAELNCSVSDSAGSEDLVRPGPVGAQVQPQDAECGVTAGGTYSTKVTLTWDIKSRTVHNYTAPLGTTADWDMTFGGWTPETCKGGPFPEDSKTSGDFGAAAIIRVPRDVIYNSSAPRLMVVAQIQGRTTAWEYLLRCDGYEYQSGWAQYPIFELPTFSVDANATKGLTVPAGGSAKFVITSKRPDLLTGIPASLWLVKDGTIKKFSDVGLKATADNETALAIARKTWDIIPRVQTWTVTAGATAPKTTYVLYVDTYPGGETDSVRLRPIAVPLTIQ